MAMFQNSKVLYDPAQVVGGTVPMLGPEVKSRVSYSKGLFCQGEPPFWGGGSPTKKSHTNIY